jgi:thiol-disulfide isomerase/thioredoxin
MKRPLLALVLCLAPVLSRALPGPGATRAEVIAAFGEPQGAFRKGAVETLAYPAGELDLRDGKLVALPAGFTERQEAGRRNAEKGLVLFDGEWMTPEERDKKRDAEQARFAERRAAAQAKANGGVTVVKKGGAAIDLPSLLPKGKVTVVDFYADWCGPCRAIAPQLEALAKGNPRVAVVKVDIVNWDTPVAKQFKLRSIPHMQVYDEDGRAVGKAGSSIAAVKETVARALAD